MEKQTTPVHPIDQQAQHIIEEGIAENGLEVQADREPDIAAAHRQADSDIAGDADLSLEPDYLDEGELARKEAAEGEEEKTGA
jgi:hypothetical protein